MAKVVFDWSRLEPEMLEFIVREVANLRRDDAAFGLFEALGAGAEAEGRRRADRPKDNAAKSLALPLEAVTTEAVRQFGTAMALAELVTVEKGFDRASALFELLSMEAAEEFEARPQGTLH